MIAPRIHSNGDRKETITEAIEAACASIRQTQAALTEVRPNARNFYVISQDAYTQAVEEHRARQQKLEDVYNELAAMHAAIEAGEIQFEVKERKRS